MPDIEIKQPASYWNLHTDELINEAVLALYRGSPRRAVEVHYGFDVNGKDHVFVRVLDPGAIVVEAPQGSTIVQTAAGWEWLTDDQAAARGIPVPTTPDS